MRSAQKVSCGAGKQRLVGDTHREADRQEVETIRSENEQLNAVVAKLILKNRILKKACWAGKRSWLNDNRGLAANRPVRIYGSDTML